MEPLVAWLWGPSFTDAKALLAFHATCRDLWRNYTAQDPKVLAPQWQAKAVFHRENNLRVMDYSARHQHCLLRLSSQAAHLNGTLLAKLQNANERLAQEDETQACDAWTNPLTNVAVLMKLGKLPCFMLEEDDIVHERGRAILAISQCWLKARFGWDLMVATEADFIVSYSPEFCETDLSNLQDMLCVGNAKYH